MMSFRGRPLQLRRIMTTGTWIPQIDGLRFIAILSVVLFHMMKELEQRAGRAIEIQPRYEFLAGLVSNGNRGVLLFFVISGYIIARPFLREHRLRGKPVDLGAYYLRRLTRLEPPYVLILLLTSVIIFVAYGMPLRTLLPHLVASTFYLHGLVYRTRSTISFVAWSLEIEAQFYLLAPLLGTIYMVRNTMVRRSVMIALMVVGSAYASYSDWPPESVFNWTLVGYLHYFMAGFLLADIVEGHQQESRRGRGWDLVSLVGWPLAFLWLGAWQLEAVLPLLFLVLCLAAFYGPASSRFFRRPFVALTGGMCYSFYLTHILAIALVFKASRHLIVFGDFLANLALQVAAMTIPVALFGTLYYVAVERPCMDPQWPRKVWRAVTRPRGSQPVVEPPNPAT
jgi:peptidoglycan/LPS O-acetylase OafA/YrhL